MNRPGRTTSQNLKRSAKKESRENKNSDSICNFFITQRKWQKKYEYDYLIVSRASG